MGQNTPPRGGACVRANSFSMRRTIKIGGKAGERVKPTQASSALVFPGARAGSLRHEAEELGGGVGGRKGQVERSVAAGSRVGHQAPGDRRRQVGGDV